MNLIHAVVAVAFLLFSPLVSIAGPMEDFVAVRAALQRNDHATAVRLLRSLVAQNFAGAKFILGTMYYSGVGVPQDFAAAFKLHREGADQGHALSQFETGAMYDKGVGVAKDQAEAFRWFRRSAEQGYGMAQFNLGLMYATGEGTTRSPVEAYKWLSLAAKGGGYMDRDEVKSEAAKRLSLVTARMTSEQIAEARSQATLWKAKPEPLVPH